MLQPQLVKFVEQLFAESGDVELVKVPDVGSRPAERVQHLQSLHRLRRRRLHRFLSQQYHYTRCQ